MNPLYLLVAAQAYFVVLGKVRLEFNVSWLDVGVALLTAIVAELGFAYFEARRKGKPFKWFIPWSAAAAAFGLAIFFRASSPLYFAGAALLAIGSKYILRVEGKHIFNPSNFAVVSMIFLFPAAATVELTQWGNDLITYLTIAAICLFIAYRAGVWLTTTSFFAAYAALLLISIPFHLDILAVHHYGLLGPSLMLFASFMITDPKTAPTGFYPRILHGLTVAAAFFLLEMMGVKYAIFVASFATALLGVLTKPLTALAMRASQRELPKNLISFSLVFVCMCGAYVYTVTTNGVFTPGHGVSLQFLLMGVESNQITQCSPEPFFRETGALGIQTPSMTTGAAWGDYDRDGREDLFISNLDERSRLYRNSATGFEDVTDAAGLPTFNSQSAFFADYDNDGKRDLFAVYALPNYWEAAEGQPVLVKPPVTVIRVFRNLGGRFIETTKELGLENFALPPSGGTLSFGDYDNDGYLDFVYAERSIVFDITATPSRAILKSFFEPFLTQDLILTCKPEQVHEILRTYGGSVLPTQELQDAYVERGGCMLAVSSIPLKSGADASTRFDPTRLALQVLYRPGSAHLFVNKGGAHFTEERSFTEALQERFERAPEQHYSNGRTNYNDITATFYQPVSFDYNHDGKLDVYLNIDWSTNLLLRNEGGLRFTEVTAEAGINVGGSGMGSDVADYDNDGDFDVVSGLINRIALWQNQGDGTFVAANTNQVNRLGTAWGITFLDYNNDGKEDLFIGNGGVEVISNVPKLDLGRPLFRSDRLYENYEGTLRDITAAAFCPMDGLLTRPVAAADYDNDGDPDLLMGYFSYGAARTPPALYANTIRGGNYLKVELRGTTSNADAAGAVVHVTAGTETYTKTLLIGSSFYAQSAHPLLFGLRDHAGPVRVEVVWPSGKRSTLHAVSPNKTITVTE